MILSENGILVSTKKKKKKSYQAMIRHGGNLVCKWKKSIWKCYIHVEFKLYHILEKAKL